jgi:DNA-binding YbaB/EbfC family protein
VAALSFGDVQRMMKQFRKFQEDMERLQEEVGRRTVEASAGGGAVRVTCSGKGELVSVAIDPAAVDPADVEMLQDLIVAAVNEGLRRAHELMAQEMGKLTGGLRLPGLPGIGGV